MDSTTPILDFFGGLTRGFGLKDWLIAVAAALCVGLAVGGVSVGVLVHKVDKAAYAALQAHGAHEETGWANAKADAEKHAREQQKAQDGVTLKAALDQAQAQERVVYRTQKAITEVPYYVTAAQDARGCVTYGLVRVLDAAVLGVDPASLQLPAGQSDDACSPVALSALASSVAGNYGVSWQNAEQLDGLIAYEKDRQRVDAP